MPPLDQWRERCSACGASIPFSLQVREFAGERPHQQRTEEPATRREQQLSDDLLAEVRHQRDQLERQVEALERKLDDAMVERAQLMALVGYLLSKGQIQPGREVEPLSLPSGDAPEGAMIDIGAAVH